MSWKSGVPILIKETVAMSRIQTRDILNLSRDFYGRMHRIYKELSERNDLQRIETLLAAIRRHVEYLENEIRALKKEAAPEVLDSWFQFSPDPPELNADPTKRLGPDMEVDDVIFIIFDFDSALVEFYQRVAESTHFEDVRRIFLNLKDSVEVEKEKLSLDVSDFKQL
jgi:hypothetical protein